MDHTSFMRGLQRPAKLLANGDGFLWRDPPIGRFRQLARQVAATHQLADNVGMSLFVFPELVDGDYVRMVA